MGSDRGIAVERTSALVVDGCVDVRRAGGPAILLVGSCLAGQMGERLVQETDTRVFIGAYQAKGDMEDRVTAYKLDFLLAVLAWRLGCEGTSLDAAIQAANAAVDKEDWPELRPFYKDEADKNLTLCQIMGGQ